MTALDVSVCHKVIEMLHTKLFIPEPDLVQENWDMPLTGNLFKMNGVHLTYLFFEIEKEFDIRIDERRLDYYGFSTINKIAALIEECTAVLR